MNQSWIGKKLTVLIDRTEGEFFVGRTQYDSPEVDQEVFVTTDRPLQVGEFYEVEITSAEPFELYGVI